MNNGPYTMPWVTMETSDEATWKLLQPSSHFKCEVRVVEKLYIWLLRALRRPATWLGVLGFLERKRSHRLSLWIRSLFSIYDMDDLARIDLPWWCLRAAEAVDSFLARRSSARVFEYGSGASTIWLARRANEVVSVEHDAPWREMVAPRLAHHANARLLFVPVDAELHEDSAHYGSDRAGWKGHTFFEYVHAIDRAAGPFDLIVIDGRARGRCLEVALAHLADDGILVFDNSGRRRYRRAIEQSGLAYKEYRGMTACLPYPDSTTLLARNPAVLAALPPSRGAMPMHAIQRARHL